MTETEQYMLAAAQRGRKASKREYRKIAREARAMIRALIERYKGIEGKEAQFYIQHIHDGIFYFVRADTAENTCYVNFMTQDELEVLGYSPAQINTPSTGT